jgi:hypothetical protein
MKQLLRAGILAAAALAAQSASAYVLFSDNFNGEHGGVGILNYTAFSKWTVSDGTVDLIGNGYFDFQPGNGLYVDMDGSTGNAGKMLSSVALNLTPGQYVLTYQLAGNHRNTATETTLVNVNVGLVSATHSLTRDADFQTFSQSFNILAPTSVSISFEGTGGDNIGMLLDNVQLECVPDGGSTLLLFGGALVFAGLGLPRARKS